MITYLNANPQPGASKHGPEIAMTGDDVTGLIFSQLYSPLDFFETLSQTLDQAVRGNYSSLLGQLVPSGDDDAKDDEDEDPADGVIRWYSWMSEASDSVVCGDANDLRHYGISKWREVVESFKARYPKVYGLGEFSPFQCAGWQTRPKYRFTGPFRSPEADQFDAAEDRSSAPLLLLSSLYDPITPLGSAHRVSKGHPGSKVLTQNSVGHCTLLASPSLCTRKVIQAYMENGTMPNDGAVCQGDCKPFQDCPHQRGRLPR